MPEMTTGTSPSLLDDLVGALRSVGKTILSICLLALVIVLGAFLVAVLVFVGGVLWLGHKLRLIKEPPRVKFQRFQGKAMAKFIQWRLAKGGFGKGFGAGNPFGGAAGTPFGGGAGNPFGGAGNPFGEAPGSPFGERPADAPDQQSIADAYRQATKQVKAKRAQADEPTAEAVQPSADADVIQEVEAEPLQTDLENFHGSLDEYMRLKKGS
jgi:hypothetical protein